MCLAISGATVVGAVFLSVKNDFAAALLPSVYPIAGAALASVYFLGKLLVVEAPLPTKTRLTVGMLQETKSGAIYSMSNIWTGESDVNLSPLFWIDAESQKPAIRERLRLEAKSEVPRNYQTKLDLLEFAIVRWLQEPEQRIGFQDTGRTEGFTGGGSGGGLDTKADVAIPIKTEGDINPLLEGWNLWLPKGSRVLRKASTKSMSRELDIETPHSHFSIRFPTQISGEDLDKTVSPTATRVISRLKLTSFQRSLWLDVFGIETQIAQVSWNRFSDQAIRENDWFRRISLGLVGEFSWSKLKERLANAPAPLSGRGDR